MSRIMGRFTFTSASLIVLALVVQQGRVDGQAYRPLAPGLGAAVILTGSLTTLRVLNASMEDAMLVRGMHRLRRACVRVRGLGGAARLSAQRRRGDVDRTSVPLVRISLRMYVESVMRVARDDRRAHGG